MATPAKSGIKNFFLSHQLMGCLMLAFVGFFGGIWITYQHDAYHEISLKPAVIMDSIYQAAKSKYPDSIKNKLLSQLTALELNSDSAHLRKLWTGKLSIDIDSMPKKIRLDNNRIIPPLKVMFYDSSIAPIPINASFHFPAKKYSTEIFFAKYPAIGIWALLIVFQLTLYFFLLPYAFVMCFGSNNTGSMKLASRKDLGTRIIYFGIIMVLFVIFFKSVLWRTETVHAAYFMDRLNRALTTANITGYALVSLLLSSVIIVGNQLSRFNFSTSTTEKKSAVIFEAEKKANDLFLVSAILLSMAVFSTGSLFTGLNSLDFVKQLNKDRGYTLFTNDAVYLYGLLHSFLLILFFAPVKRIIANAKAKLPAAGVENGPNKNLSAVIAHPMKGFIELLVTSSPLLAGLLQSMLDFIIKQ